MNAQTNRLTDKLVQNKLKKTMSKMLITDTCITIWQKYKNTNTDKEKL